MMEEEEAVVTNGFVVPSQRERRSSPPPRGRQRGRWQSPVRLLLSTAQTHTDQPANYNLLLSAPGKQIVLFSYMSDSERCLRVQFWNKCECF